MTCPDRHLDHTHLHHATQVAMGARATVTTDASALTVDAAFAVVALLERRWSEPDNPRPATERLVETAEEGRVLTDGWFESAPVIHRVGRGWAADAAATMLYDNGASFVTVEVGATVRIRSRHRAVVEIAPPDTILTASVPSEPLRLSVQDAGVAVSSLPPVPADGHGPRVAAVLTATASGAAMLAAAAAVAPLACATRFLERAGATAWLVDANGHLTTVGRPARFLLDDGWLGDWTRGELAA